MRQTFPRIKYSLERKHSTLVCVCVHHYHLLKAIFYLTTLKYKLRSFVADGVSFSFLLSFGNEQFYTKFNINELT